MPNINLLQNTTGEEPKPKDKKEPIPAYTKPPAEASVTESKPAKKLSPLGSFFGGTKSTVSVRPPTIPSQQPSIRIEKPSLKPAPKSFEPELAKPNVKKHSWLGGIINFTKPKSKITEERIVVPSRQPSSQMGDAAIKPLPVRGKKLLEEKTTISPKNEEIIRPSWLGVNLMPDDTLAGLEPAKKLVTYLIVLLISAGIIGGGYGALVWYENGIYDQAEQTTADIAQVNSKIIALRPEHKRALVFKYQADAIKSILDQHIYWTQFFSKLEKYTLPEVEYQSFAGTFAPGSNPTFSISAATNSYDSLAKQILAFREAVDNGDFISASVIESGNKVTDKDAGTESVQFTVQITSLEKVFYNRIGDQADSNNQ